MAVLESFKFNRDISLSKHRSGIWYISHPDKDGERIHYSTGIRGSRTAISQHVKDAKIPELVTLSKSNALTDTVISRLTTGKSKVTNMEAVKEWKLWFATLDRSRKTGTNYENTLMHWLKAERIWDKRPSQVKISDIDGFVNPPDTRLKKSTLDDRLYAIRSFFKYCTANGYSIGNPSIGVEVKTRPLSHRQKERAPIEAFTQAEVKRILAHLDKETKDHQLSISQNEYYGMRGHRRRESLEKKISTNRFLYSATLLAYGCGLRFGDIATLEWDSITREGIVVHTSKRQKRVFIPLTDKAVEHYIAEADPLKQPALIRAFPHIQHWTNEGIASLDLSGGRFVFPLQAPQPQTNHSQAYKRMLTACGIQGKTFHGLRHALVRSLRRTATEGGRLCK
jgi:integrase